MKKILFPAAFALLSLNLFAQGVKSEKFTPFFTKEIAPHMERVIPEPPALTDALFFYDWSQYQWGKSIRDTERGELAVKDAGINAEYFMKRFSPVVERDLTPDEYPHLYRLFSRLHLTEQQAGASAKEYFHRVRPYQQFKEPTAVPNHESPTDFTSYPSGHTHASWLVGLALTAIDPAHTEDIMKVAYELGQSRVIVGFHYQSDVDAGRVVSSITFARLQSEPEFQKMMEKARKEYEKKKR